MNSELCTSCEICFIPFDLLQYSLNYYMNYCKMYLFVKPEK